MFFLPKFITVLHTVIINKKEIIPIIYAVGLLTTKSFDANKQILKMETEIIIICIKTLFGSGVVVLTVKIKKKVLQESRLNIINICVIRIN